MGGGASSAKEEKKDPKKAEAKKEELIQPIDAGVERATRTKNVREQGEHRTTAALNYEPAPGAAASASPKGGATAAAASTMPRAGAASASAKSGATSSSPKGATQDQQVADRAAAEERAAKEKEKEKAAAALAAQEAKRKREEKEEKERKLEEARLKAAEQEAKERKAEEAKKEEERRKKQEVEEAARAKAEQEAKRKAEQLAKSQAEETALLNEPGMVHVTVLRVASLHAKSASSTAEAYCLFKVPTKAGSEARTPAVSSKADPVWNHGPFGVKGYKVGDELEFQVWEKDGEKAEEFLGKGLLKSAKFRAKGFSGTLALEGGNGPNVSQHARLEVKVTEPETMREAEECEAMGVEDAAALQIEEVERKKRRDEAERVRLSDEKKKKDDEERRKREEEAEKKLKLEEERKLQALLEEKSIRVFMLARGLEFSSLDAQPSLRSGFEAALKSSLSSGMGFKESDVHLQLSGGSVVIKAAVCPPAGSFEEVIADLRTSKSQISQLATEKVRAVTGVDLIATGEVVVEVLDIEAKAVSDGSLPSPVASKMGTAASVAHASRTFSRSATSNLSRSLPRDRDSPSSASRSQISPSSTARSGFDAGGTSAFSPNSSARFSPSNTQKSFRRGATDVLPVPETEAEAEASVLGETSQSTLRSADSQQTTEAKDAKEAKEVASSPKLGATSTSTAEPAAVPQAAESPSKLSASVFAGLGVGNEVVAAAMANASQANEMLALAGADDDLREESFMEEVSDGQDEVSVIIASVGRIMASGVSSLKRGNVQKARKQMEKAFQVLEGKEQSHPALMVEASRARLNYSAALSQGGQHLEAIDAIKEAQRSLSGVLEWADECGDGDPGVGALAAEGKALLCAALVAEGIELESTCSAGQGARFAEQGAELQWPPPPDPTGLHVELYEEARSLAEERLPARHPVTALAKRLADGAVCAAPGGDGDAPGKRRLGAYPQEDRVSLPPIADSAPSPSGQPGTRVGSKASMVGSKASMRSAADQGAGAGPIPWQLERPESPHQHAMTENLHLKLGQSNSEGALLSSGRRAVERDLGATAPPGGAGAPRSPSKSRRNKSGTRATSTAALSGVGRKKDEKPNIFAEFLREAEAEMDAKRQGSETWQDDARRRLQQVHRSTRLMLELSEDVELKDKKYTNNGHKVIMAGMMKDNKSRTDKQLVREARKAGAPSPEVYQVKKYNKDLYVKPPTPPPAPKEVAPKIDMGLAEMLSMRPKAQTEKMPDAF